MKTKEMIEVMEAFERGEEIEFSRVYTDDWRDIGSPNWNWDQYKYRIKAKYKVEEMEPKFKKGDIIVNKYICDGTPLNRDSDLLVVEDIDLFKEKYEIYDKGLAVFKFCDIEEIDEDYLNVDDCLWFWEYYDDNYKTFTTTALRYNKEDCIDYLRRTTSHSAPTTIYQLGARLPENKK